MRVKILVTAFFCTLNFIFLKNGKRTRERLNSVKKWFKQLRNKYKELRSRTKTMAQDRTITISDNFCVSLGMLSKTLGTSRRNITHLTNEGLPYYWVGKQKTFPLVKCVLWIIKNHSLTYRKDLSSVGL